MNQALELGREHENKSRSGPAVTCMGGISLVFCETDQRSLVNLCVFCNSVTENWRVGQGISAVDDGLPKCFP